MKKKDYVIMIVRIGMTALWLSALLLLTSGCSRCAIAARAHEAVHASSAAAQPTPRPAMEAAGTGHWSHCVKIWTRNPLTGKYYVVCAYWLLGDPAVMSRTIGDTSSSSEPPPNMEPTKPKGGLR